MRLIRLGLVAALLLVTSGDASAWHIGLYGGCGPRLCMPYAPLGVVGVVPAAPLTLGYSVPLGMAVSPPVTFGYTMAAAMPYAAGQAAPTLGMQAGPTFAAQGDLADAVGRLRTEVSGLKSDLQALGRITGSHSDMILDLQRRTDALERARSAPK